MAESESVEDPPEALQLPDEEPPRAPVPCLQSFEESDHRAAEQVDQGFLQVFEEMKVLMLRLLDAHEVEMKRSPEETNLGELTPAPTTKTVTLITEPENSRTEVTPQRSRHKLLSAESIASEAQPQHKRMSSRLIKEARQKTVDMEQMLENNSMESCALQLREEWDLPEEKLLELKRMQRRMSCGSLQSLAKPTIRRQYLVRVKEPGPCYVINPNSWKRTAWDGLAMLAVLFEVCVTPLHLYRIDESLQHAADVMHWVLTAFWVLDIPASFFTAVYVNDVLRFRLTDIARYYLKSWFLFDFLMLLPDLIVLLLPGLDDGTTGLLRISRARRMFRLLRFLQMFRFSKVLEKFQIFEKNLLLGVMQSDIGMIFRPVFNVVMILMLSAHVLGSLWFAVGDTEGGWVIEERLHEAVLSRQYTRSLEWALSKLPPSALRVVVELNTPAERWLGILATCVVMLSSSLFVSFITNTMGDVNRKRTRTKEILQAVRTYCGTHHVSFNYTMQIKRYVYREQARNELQRHMPLLQNLPEGMVRELFQEGRSQTLHGHAFFQDIGRSDPSMELNLCSQAVSELHLLAGDTIFNTTSKVQGMYMLAAGFGIYFYWPPFQDGRPQPRNRKYHGPASAASATSIMDYIIGPSMTTNQRVNMGMAQQMINTEEYLAEPALWVKAWRYQGHLQALIESRALLVSTDQLFQVCQDYANVLANTVVYARCFVAELNKSANLCREVTDLPLIPPSKSSEPGAASWVLGSSNARRVRPAE